MTDESQPKRGVRWSATLGVLFVILAIICLLSWLLKTPVVQYTPANFRYAIDAIHSMPVIGVVAVIAFVAKSRAGLSYSLRTTQRFASEFGISDSPRDLKSALARALTDQERGDWEAYRLATNEEHERARMGEAYQEAVSEVAATRLARRAPSPRQLRGSGPAVTRLMTRTI